MKQASPRLASPPFIPFHNRQWLVDRCIHTEASLASTPWRCCFFENILCAEARLAESCFSVNGSLSARLLGFCQKAVCVFVVLLWIMFDEEKLISLVSNYKSLYDKSDRFYDDNTVRENQWKEIAKEMNEQGNISTEATHDNIVDEHETPNTEISEESTPPLYGDSTCSLTAVFDDGSFSQSSVSGSSIISPVSGRTTGPSKKRQKQDEPTVASVLGKYLLSKKEQPQHPIDKFFLSLTEDVKNLPLHLQLRVKQDVLKVVSQAQLEATYPLGPANHPQCQGTQEDETSTDNNMCSPVLLQSLREHF